MELDLEHPLPSLDCNHDSKHLKSDSSLFQIESQHMPINTNITSITSNQINPQFVDHLLSSCQQTISSILSSSPSSDHFLSYLAINYLHRFVLNKPTILQESAGKPWMLKLLAVSCISLALKMRKPEDSVTHIVQHDGGIIFDKQTIERMELLILGGLKWRMRSITPFSFINFFISFFKYKDPPLREALKARATEIIFKSQLELKILEFKPSIVAASALLSASHELFPLQFQGFENAISACSYVNKVNFSRCYNVMQEIAMDGYECVLDTVSSSETAVNVLDRQWASSSSDESENKESENGTIGVEMRDFKRRKVISFTTSDEMFQLSQN